MAARVRTPGSNPDRDNTKSSNTYAFHLKAALSSACMGFLEAKSAVTLYHGGSLRHCFRNKFFKTLAGDADIIVWIVRDQAEYAMAATANGISIQDSVMIIARGLRIGRAHVQIKT